MKHSLLLLAVLLTVTTQAHAAPTQWAFSDYDLRFEVPLTVGSHDGTIVDVDANLTLDPEDLAHTRGSIVAPIAGFDTGNDRRDCHLREALGLDYAKSVFPDEHVCKGKKIPDGAIEHPEVTVLVEWLEHGVGETWYVQGSVSLHGVSLPLHDDALPLTLRFDGDRLLVEATWTVSLADHAVVVKNVPLIKVEDTIVIKLRGTLVQAD